MTARKFIQSQIKNINKIFECSEKDIRHKQLYFEAMFSTKKLHECYCKLGYIKKPLDLKLFELSPNYLSEVIVNCMPKSHHIVGRTGEHFETPACLMGKKLS